MAEQQETKSDSVAAAATDPNSIIDLRQADVEDAGSAWLTETRPFRLIGSMAWGTQFCDTPLSATYDLIVFIEEATTARPL